MSPLELYSCMPPTPPPPPRVPLIFCFSKLFLGYEECRGEFKRTRTPSKQQHQHQVAAIIDNQQPGGDVCYMLYCCLYCFFLHCSCSCCSSCRLAFSRRCNHVVLLYLLFCVVVLVLVVALVVGGVPSMSSFFVVRRSSPSARPVLPFLLLSQCIVVSIVSCCFVLFRVVSRCFVLLLSLSMWLLLCSYLLSLGWGD